MKVSPGGSHLSTSGTSTRDSASARDLKIIEKFVVGECPKTSHVTSTEAAFFYEQSNNS